MNQAGPCAVQANSMSVSNAAEALEGQQGVLRGMLDNLERALFGNDVGMAKEPEPKLIGLEAKLGNMVSNNERLLTQFDRILSRL